MHRGVQWDNFKIGVGKLISGALRPRQLQRVSLGTGGSFGR